MKSLFFIFGILFSQYIMPIMDGFGTLMLTWMESKKAKHNEIVTASNIKLRKLADKEDDDTPKYHIGFAPPVKKEKETEEEDDEDED